MSSVVNQSIFSRDILARNHALDCILNGWVNELNEYVSLQGEGKMFGVLLGTWTQVAQLPRDVQWVNQDNSVVCIRAYSGQLNGVWHWPSWAPSLLDHHRVAGESWRVQYTLHTLTQEIHKAQNLERANRVILLKKRRAELSREYAQTLRKATTLHALNHQVSSLADWWPTAPTGVGECCAPKLICRAAQLQVKPIGIAEFWWGPEPKKIPARVVEKRSILPLKLQSNIQYPESALTFYAPCETRCMPLMPYLLGSV